MEAVANNSVTAMRVLCDEFGARDVRQALIQAAANGSVDAVRACVRSPLIDCCDDDDDAAAAASHFADVVLRIDRWAWVKQQRRDDARRKGTTAGRTDRRSVHFRSHWYDAAAVLRGVTHAPSIGERRDAMMRACREWSAAMNNKKKNMPTAGTIRTVAAVTFKDDAETQ